MPIAVGIHLGTIRSAVAVYMNEKITVIPQDNGKDFIPSIVSFTSNDILVGQLAEEQCIVNPENTIYGVKRIIGRKLDDPQLQKFLSNVSYNIENFGENPKISVFYKGGSRLYDPENISAMILEKLKLTTEIFLGHKVISAVISVPAFFNDSQRQATKDAGSLAGLNVLQILNEPTAAAIAYGLDKISENEKYILIYDFGSEMFDVSILKIKKGDPIETQSTGCDTSLGGFVFDDVLVDYFADLFYKEHKKNIKSEFRDLWRLRIACSHAKDILSNKNETVIAIDALTEEIDFHVTITRSRFEELCEDIFNRAIQLLHQVIVNSNINKKDIDDVILVGGSSEIPKLRKVVSDYFDNKYVSRNFNSALAVTYGAAVQAAYLSGYKDRNIKHMLCVDVTPLSIGIETSGGIMSNIIERGTPIPTNASCTFTTHTDNQPGVAIRIFEGERVLTCNNHLLGTLELLGLPLLPRGVPKIMVTFEIDSNGILNVSAEEMLDMKFATISIKLDKGRHSEDDINRILTEANEIDQEDELERDRSLYRNSLENFVHAVCKTFFTNVANKTNAREKLEINKICNEIRDWLETNPSANKEAITEKRNAAITFLQPYACFLDQDIMKSEDIKFIEVSNRTEKRSLEVEKYES